MKQEIFLIDTNSLITPYANYYPFELFPTFWKQLKDQIIKGSVVILDFVKNEVEHSKDELSDWIKEIPDDIIVNHKNIDIISKWAEIMNYIQTSPCYKEQALQEWSRDTVADPWLIATAAIYGYTIITFERPNNGLNAKSPSKNPKVPDVAAKFGVKTKNLYQMMKELNFVFK